MTSEISWPLKFSLRKWAQHFENCVYSLPRKKYPILTLNLRNGTTVPAACLVPARAWLEAPLTASFWYAPQNPVSRTIPRSPTELRSGRLQGTLHNHTFTLHNVNTNKSSGPSSRQLSPAACVQCDILICHRRPSLQPYLHYACRLLREGDRTGRTLSMELERDMRLYIAFYMPWGYRTPFQFW